MTDPLAGMSVKEARELVAEVVSAQAAPNVLAYKNGCGVNATDVRYILALAALGAECVGAITAPVVEVEFAEDSDKVRVTCEVDGPHRFSSASRVLVLKEDK